MKTFAEKYPDKETWNSGARHDEAIRLREERRQKDMSIKQEIEDIEEQSKKIKEITEELKEELDG